MEVTVRLNCLRQILLMDIGYEIVEG